MPVQNTITLYIMSPAIAKIWRNILQLAQVAAGRPHANCAQLQGCAYTLDTVHVRAQYVPCTLYIVRAHMSHASIHALGGEGLKPECQSSAQVSYDLTLLAKVSSGFTEMSGGLHLSVTVLGCSGLGDVLLRFAINKNGFKKVRKAQN